MAAVFLAVRAVPCLAAGDERPAVTRIDLYVRDGSLTGDVASRGLFSEQIVGTVQSGLPAVLELFYVLNESGGGTVDKGVRAFSLSYDVWGDVYSVAAGDTTTRLPSFEAMRSMVERLNGIALVPADRMRPDRSYFVQMSLAVSPLQGTDKRKVAGWVKENVQSTGQTVWHEQLLNLNELIAHFFSGKDDSARRSTWVRSASFEPRLLPVRDQEGKQ
jgi:DNA-binding transcriptional LysR family regulator